MCFSGGDGEPEEDEVAVELHETVLVSGVEDDGIAVHGFSPDELVIQDAMGDVVAEYVQDDDEEEDEEGLNTIAVGTCVMSPGIALEDVLNSSQGQEDSDGCENYLMISCEWSHFMNMPCVAILSKHKYLHDAKLEVISFHDLLAKLTKPL